MEPLYVNPEALGTLAHPYYAAGENYQHIGEAYDEILPKFEEGIGRDKTGEAFYQQFIQAATELGLRVKNLQDAMNYCGEGLTQTSELYSQAEDDAEETVHALEAEMDETLAPTGPPQKAQPLQPAQAAVLYAKTEVVRVNEKGERVNEKGELIEAPLRRTAVKSVHPGDAEYAEATPTVAYAKQTRRGYSSVNPWELAGVNASLPYRPLSVTQLTPAEQAMAERQAFSTVGPWELAGMKEPPPGMGAYQPLSMTQLPGQNGQPGMLVVRTPDGNLLGIQPPAQPNQGVTANPQQGGQVPQAQYAPGHSTEGAVTSPLVPDGNGNMVPAVGKAEPLLQRAEVAFTPVLPLPLTPPEGAVPGTPFMTVVVAESGPLTREDGVVVAEARPTEVQVVLGVTPPS